MKCKGKVIIHTKQTAQIKIGAHKGPFGKGGCSFFYMDEDSVTEFDGRAKICSGFVIVNNQRGKISFGINFHSGYNFTVTSSSSVEFGENTLVGWNVTIRDTDGHAIWNLLDASEMINPNRPVTIKNNVWIGSEASILKGVLIENGSIVGTKAVVTHDVPESVIVAGNPARIVKRNIAWTRDEI